MPASRGLYAITSSSADTTGLLRWASAVIDGGAVWLQYRDKSADSERRLTQASALATLCRAHKVSLIVNDDVDLARASGADGVHLGEHDGDLAHARRRLGSEAVIGVSCYDDLDRALTLAEAGADYLAFGAFFASMTKPQARTASSSLLVKAKPAGKPLVAIGGISPDNGGELIRAGADLLAVIGGLAGPAEAAGMAARRYAALFSHSPSELQPLP